MIRLFCLVLSDLLNSSFHGFKYKHDFGLFKTKFTSKDLVAVNVIAVLPSVLMGIGGGVLGSAFTHVNLIFAKWRKGKKIRALVKIRKNFKMKFSGD